MDTKRRPPVPRLGCRARIRHYADRACCVGLVVLAVVAVAFVVKVWQICDGYWGPHVVKDLAELREFTHETLPTGTVLVAARQEVTPGENNLWAVLQMPARTAEKWLREPPFEQVPTPKPSPDDTAWIMRASPWDWDAWHPDTARDFLFNEGGNRWALADMNDPAIARVYIYWLID